MTKRHRQRRPYDPAALDALTALLERGWEARTTPDDVFPSWVADQYRAAAHEAHGRLMAATVPGFHRPAEIVGTPRRAALLSYAMLRHTHTWCPHLKDGPRIAVALIDSGWVGCQACAKSLRPRLDDDPRCRLCDTIPDTYTPHILQVGPVMYTVETCPACHFELTGIR